MVAKRSKVLQATLRQRLDDDLSDAIKKLPSHINESELIRDALRLYFFGSSIDNKINKKINISTEYETIELDDADISDEELEANLAKALESM